MQGVSIDKVKSEVEEKRPKLKEATKKTYNTKMKSGKTRGCVLKRKQQRMAV